MKSKKSALLKSLIALLLCLSMLVGTTFAWFTDSVSTGINTIAAGTLDVELYHTNAAAKNEKVDSNTDLFLDLQGEPILWEPGVVSYENLRVRNEGDLALAYQMAIATANENYVIDGNDQYGLSQILKVGVVEGGITAADRAGVVASVEEGNWTTLSEFVRNGSLMAEGKGESEEVWGLVVYWEPGEDDNRWNLNNGKELDSGEALQIDLGINLIATQEMYESDSFGNDYDVTAKTDVFPVMTLAGAATVTVKTDGENKVAKEAVLTSGQITATVPEGVQMEAGATALTLTVSEMESTGSNITLGDGEAMRSLDVHVAGIDSTNTVPVIVDLGKVMAAGLNLGNYALHHVENGTTVPMTKVDSLADLDEHNEFFYDPATGNVTVAMKSFSEVTMVAEPPKWEGEFDYSWYTNTKARAETTEYVIANADQLAAFGAIVGGMAEAIEQDSFAGKTVKLISDINLGDAEAENNPDLIFYPIGYNSSDGMYEKTGVAVTTGFYNFCGTFDGNGHTIANFYQNTWEMKGDNNYYDATLQYFRDGMGLFGRVYKGTVKNLTVHNFKSDGEYTTTGVIAAYADGATFENIAITKCNPRVYNIGNGGIVGCVGWYAKEAGLKTTFKNVTVDNSNKISALWGSYDVACGGIVGQYYPTSGQSSAGKPVNGGVSFENCHIAAQMDVYNDVCGNYQYYAYRYAGMMIGSVRENVTIDGHVYPKMDGITASGCTVHFGTWNDYYYCEIIDNTTASYTHDYQMSRLTEIKAIDGTTITYLDGTTGTVPASGRANYVIVDYTKGHGTQNATCYHFKDGAVWTHDMGGIQTGIDENGDGKDDLKEDKQHIYLEFNNLVTGYGWGVTSKGLKDFEGVENLDITAGDHEKSVVKFGDAGKNEVSNNVAIKASELFSYIEKCGVAVKNESFHMGITNVDENGKPIENGTVTADFTPADNWADSTLTLYGIGRIQITAQDYYFCVPTTITVNVTDRQPAEKFDIVMNNGDFLHRVGNNGTVPLDKLFKAKDGVTVGTVSVTIESVDGTGASGTYSNNAIQFSGTGVVKVTITDNDYCVPTVLNLEVVDATNLTSAKGTTAGENFVLLCNVSTTAYQYYTNSKLYGNGFTYSLNGAPTDYNSKQGHGILIASGATFDNVVIIGDVYKSYGAYTNQSNYNAAIHATNTTIQNCYVANCATPVRGSDVTIINSTLYGGTVANLILSSGTNTLKDVTTVNYNDDRSVLGLGIVVNDEAAENTKIVINGSLKQYNYVCQSDASKVPGTEAKALFNSMFGSAFDVFKTDGYINTGIVIMSESLNTDIITGSVEGYEKLDDAKISLSVGGLSKTVNGAVYAPKGNGATVDNEYSFEDDNHASDVQGAYLPAFELDLGSYYDANDGESDTRYCYESVDNKEVRLLYQDGQTPFTFDLTKLASVTKFGYSLETTVTCKNASGEVLATNTSVTLRDAGMYTFEITVNDNIIYGADGKLTGESVSRTYVVNVELSVKKASWKNAEITLSSPGSNSGYNSSKYYVLDFLDAISITDYSENGTSEQVDLWAEYDSYDIVYGNTTSYAWAGFTLTINYKDGRVLTVTFGAPSGLSSPGASAGGKTISLKTDNSHGYLLQTDGKINTKVSGTWPITKCTFKGANTVTVENTTVINIAVDKNTTINVSSGSSDNEECIIEGSLITMADGTQKPVEELNVGDMVLAFNHISGKFEAAPIIFNTHADQTEAKEYDVLHLEFANGKDLEIVAAHGLFDMTLMKYVYVTYDNYKEFIGHKFYYAGNDGSVARSVVLKNAYIEKETVRVFCPVTYFHMNSIANGFLNTPNIPGGITGLVNYFEYDPDLKYNEEAMQRDIAKYGVYTYADFSDYISEAAYLSSPAVHLKVAVGKGMITFEEILDVIEYLLSGSLIH